MSSDQFRELLRTKKIFVKIGAPLVQKCSALPEYSQELDLKQKMQIQNKIEGQKILLLFLE